MLFKTVVSAEALCGMDTSGEITTEVKEAATPKRMKG